MTEKSKGLGLWEPATTEQDLQTGYLADRGKIQSVRMLAFAQIALALFSAGPALSHLNLATAPDWARLLLLVAGLQITYALWLMLLADWSSVWVSMAIWAATAAAYGLFWTAIAFTAVDDPLEMLDLDSIRGRAAGWCFAMLIFAGIMTAVCGRTAARWRKLLEMKKRV